MKRMWSKNELRKIIQETYGIDINNLIDKDGHERFIEGDITIEEIEGITQSYGKWSLSGTHLMIVVAGNIADTTALSWGTKIANIVLPDWIFEKIVPIFATYYVEAKSTPLYDINLGTQTVSSILRKQSGKLDLLWSNVTANADRSFRVAFDLLIDNE